jgi:uncharacterized repeat protein (TIGR01451 family)
VGASFNYTLTVANAGPDTAQAVTVTDNIPAGLTLVSATTATPGATCSAAGGTVSCQLGNLASGGQAQIVIVVIANVAGLVVNTATVSSPTADPDPSDNTDSEGTTIGTPPAGQASITIEKHTVPNGTPGSFSFTGAISATLSDDGAASESVDAGRYTVRESNEKGWTLVRIECFDSNGNGTRSVGNIEAKTATFNVEDGEIVLCVFTNVKDEVQGEVIERPSNPDADVVDDKALAAPRALPFTGSNTLTPLIWAAMLIGLGTLLLGSLRRRRVGGNS